MTLTVNMSVRPDAIEVVVQSLGGESLLSKAFEPTSTLNELAAEIACAFYQAGSEIVFFSDDGKVVGNRGCIHGYKRLTVQEDHFKRWVAVNQPYGNMEKAFQNAKWWPASAVKTEAIERIDAWTSIPPRERKNGSTFASGVGNC